ncbi:MAG: hypothetical protein QXE61_08590 [Nitrososphaerota archaeon]
MYEENRLVSLIKGFDFKLCVDYLARVKDFKECLENEGLDSHFEYIRDATLTEPVALRLKFYDPVFVMLSHPLCRLNTRVLYPIEYEWERFWVTQLGMLPVYFVSLNTITVVKFWAEKADQASAEALNTLPNEEDVFLQLVPNERGVHFSTMNFIIPFGSPLFIVPSEMGNLLRNYLKYAYWSSPKHGFSCSSHFLHSRDSIKYLMKVTKTLCIVDEVDKPANIPILNRVIRTRRARLRMLIEKDNKFSFAKISANIPEDVLAQLEKEEEPKQRFLNAILLEVREKSGSFELLNVVCDIGASYYELVQTLTGYILTSQYYRNDSISISCSTEELRKKTNRILDQIAKDVRLPYTVSDLVDNAFDIAMTGHIPMFLGNDDTVWFLHPLVLGYLFRKRWLDLVSPSKRIELIQFLNYLEKIRTGSTRMQLYLDDKLDEIARTTRTNKSQVLTELIKLTRMILISKLLRNHF